MAHDSARAVSQSVIEPVGRDFPGVPTPRSPVREPALAPAENGIAPPARRHVVEPAAHDSPRPVHGPRVGGILIAGVAAAAAWGVGWIAGVTWAWRKMTPRYIGPAEWR